jgi:Tfp pilus assembly PilM family ATPase
MLHELDSVCEDYALRVGGQVATALDYAKYRYADKDVHATLVFGGAASIDRVALAIGVAGGLATSVLHPTDVMSAHATLARDASHPCLITATGLAMHPRNHA